MENNNYTKRFEILAQVRSPLTAGDIEKMLTKPKAAWLLWKWTAGVSALCLLATLIIIRDRLLPAADTHALRSANSQFHGSKPLTDLQAQGSSNSASEHIRSSASQSIENALALAPQDRITNHTEQIGNLNSNPVTEIAASDRTPNHTPLSGIPRCELRAGNLSIEPRSIRLHDLLVPTLSEVSKLNFLAGISSNLLSAREASAHLEYALTSQLLVGASAGIMDHTSTDPVATVTFRDTTIYYDGKPYTSRIGQLANRQRISNLPEAAVTLRMLLNPLEASWNFYGGVAAGVAGRQPSSSFTAGARLLTVSTLWIDTRFEWTAVMHEQPRQAMRMGVEWLW